MADRFVRKTGLDSNGGTSPSDAWLTITKALSATGISSGDVLYIGAGTYRETVSVAMTNPTAETKIIGDTDGAKTGDSGPVILTAYTTNDQTAPSSTTLLDLAGRDYITIERLAFVQGAATTLIADGTLHLRVRDCLFQGSLNVNNWNVSVTATFGTDMDIVIERCVWRETVGAQLVITLPTGSGADYDANITIRNCVFHYHRGYASISINGQGALANYGGGVRFYNCSVFSTWDAANIAAQTTVLSTTYPVIVRNCLLLGGLSATTSGMLTSDYNRILGSVAYTNVTGGANDVTGNSYAVAFGVGAEYLWGGTTRPYGEPLAGANLLGFGNDGTYTSAEDARGFPRPAGGSSALKGIGAYERGNSGIKETSTTRTGPNALKILGPGYHDFDVPVGPSSTTVTIYTRWDATYAGTKPQMLVRNGTECGVSDASTTATGSSGQWEQLTLNFTPTAAGVVTIRLQSNDTNGGGSTFFDDFAVT